MDVQLNDRHSTQLEELVQLKGKLTLPSSRSRNLSSDRQHTPALLSDFRSTRNSDKQESQSVEKFLNLRQQNQNVDNLLSQWKQQKQSIQLNSSSLVSGSMQEIPEYDQQQIKFSQLIIPEEDFQIQEQENNNKCKIISATNNVRVAGKFPSSTKIISKKTNTQQGQANYQTKKVAIPITQSRPQTTKSQNTQPQTPCVNKKVNQKSSIKSFQDTISEVQQTPTQKMKQSSLLEKSRQGKNNQTASKVLLKKNSDEEKLLLIQIGKLKESITKLYDQRFDKQMSHSSSFIEKNFDQIINTIKLDFRCLENDI